MWPYFPELLAVPVPRYTSYPTAAEFGEGVNAGHFTRALQRVQGDISLYVHIPFCEKICWYCGCNTKAIRRYEPVETYVVALLKEIARISSLLGQVVQAREWELVAGQNEMPFDISQLQPGTYILQIEGEAFGTRFVVLR